MEEENINLLEIKKTYFLHLHKSGLEDPADKEQENNKCLEFIRSQNRSFQSNPTQYCEQFSLNKDLTPALPNNRPPKWVFSFQPDFVQTHNFQYCHQCRSKKREDQLYFCSNNRHPKFHPFYHKKKQKNYEQQVLLELVQQKQQSKNNKTKNKGESPVNIFRHCGKVFCLTCINKSYLEKRINGKPSSYNLVSSNRKFSTEARNQVEQHAHEWFCISCMGHCPCKRCSAVSENSKSS